MASVVGASGVLGASGALGTAGLGGKSLFDYNRENFLFDRDQRMKKEFQERHFRLRQASLWREDVRDIVELVELKMTNYLLVNVLMLGFDMSLWMQGRLPQGTPVWLMLGNQIGIGGSFTFLLLTVWLAVYAAVSAQSYGVRILTQLVRLPVPSWRELEACRTYGSSFEQVEPSQMFRVPFAMGNQAPRTAGAAGREPPTGNMVGAGEAGDSVTDTTTMVSGTAATPAGLGAVPRAESLGTEVSTDPWGLERRGDDLYELGCPYKEEIARLRHIKLIRHASVCWATYDAFARICMSVGVNQLMLALSYYYLGYGFVQIECPIGAYVAVTALIGLAEIVVYLDMSLPPVERRTIQALLCLGPFMSCIAAFHWSVESEWTDWIAGFIAPFAFLAHALLLLLIGSFCDVKEHECAGRTAMLPGAFGGVLYLDVFGWLPKEAAAPLRSGPTVLWEPLIGPGSGRASDDVEALRDPHERPAPHSVAYNSDGARRPVATRPDDCDPHVVPNADGEELMFGRVSYTVDAVHTELPPPEKFYQAASFMPPGALRGDMTEECADREMTSWQDIEGPAKLPAKVFKYTIWFLAFVWIVAGGAAFWKSVDALMTWTASHNTNETSIVNATDGSLGHPETILLSWPLQHVVPRSLSCDAAGRRFVVTDGLSTFTAELRGSSRGMSSKIARRARHRLIDTGAAQDFAERSRRSVAVAAFAEIERCPALLGEALQDTALSCSGRPGDCALLVLHRHGRRVTACPLMGACMRGREQAVTNVSRTWLRPGEKVAWILVGSVCEGVDAAIHRGCITLGTTQGRVARMRHEQHSVTATGTVNNIKELFPSDVFPDENGVAAVSLTKLQQRGVVRELGGGFIGFLETNRRSLWVLDAGGHGRPPRSLTLPAPGPVSTFCVGGGYVYALAEGANPELWRFPVAPAGLSGESLSL